MVQGLDWRGKSRNGATNTVVGSALVFNPNPVRKLATFVNNSVNWMYLCKSTVAAVNTGIPLAPNGGAYEINQTNPYFGAIAVACGVINQVLAWTEDE